MSDYNANGYQFFSLTDANTKEWNAFVLSSQLGSIHQISDWKNFQEQIPGRGPVLGFGVKEKGEIKATIFCVRMGTGFLGKYWWYSARGPVFDPKEKAVGIFLIEKVTAELKRKGGMFWRFDPYFPQAFELPGVQTRNATQNYQPTDTLEIDLTQTNDEILSYMKRKGRYNINLAQKKGVRVTFILGNDITKKDIDDFWRLNTETTRRDSFSGHEKSYYEKFLKHLKKYAVLFFAEFEGKRIASAISTFCGSKAIYYFGASSSDAQTRPLMAPYLLQWEMMQYAKKKGCLTYDFLGIAPEDETNHPYAGISEFKWKFGGERKTYASGQEIVFQSVWYTLYRLAKKLKRV
ncbi:peptidoglycan bridge formation glycyltransferase FemA/FemB family protein [Candidatus Gracilibacteria bacterium]|nr:peptidoglycan bridge formation glycyltransferase FemA/FemB family protein [Candidatus Gracilibacteria bacterium]